jgi:xylulokinase
MELRQGKDIMVDLGCSFNRLVASGGGTQHPLWLQLQADILKCPIYQTTTVEAAALGAALLAGVGVNIYPNIYTACQQTVRWKDEVVQPIPENVDLYDDMYEYFLKVYPTIKSFLS